MIESSFSTLEVYFLTPPQVLPQLTLKVTFLSQPRFAPARRRPAGPTPPLDRDGTRPAPDPGLLRATKGVGESQTQLRWVSRAHRCPPQAYTPRLWARIQARGDLGLQLKENPTVNYFCSM